MHVRRPASAIERTRATRHGKIEITREGAARAWIEPSIVTSPPQGGALSVCPFPTACARKWTNRGGRRLARYPGRDSNPHTPCGAGGFKPPASAVPPPGRGRCAATLRRGRAAVAVQRGEEGVAHAAGRLAREPVGGNDAVDH